MANASASDTDLLMSAEVTDYLRAADVLPDGVPAEVSELGGGVSNQVLRVTTEATSFAGWTRKRQAARVRRIGG